MIAERILLPIDVVRCPLEVFTLVTGFARRPEVTVILLHVVNLNIVVPENRVFQELAAEAKSYLERLADQHLPPITSHLSHVRMGEPAEEILAEAQVEKPDFIILPTYSPSLWDRLKAVWKPGCNPIVSRLAERIIREATCGVFVVAAKTRFNCEQAWGRPVMGDFQIVHRYAGNHHSPELAWFSLKS